MTLDELDALQRFREHKCKSAPWLLDIAESPVQPGTHERDSRRVHDLDTHDEAPWRTDHVQHILREIVE
jgi:hypothetical protein